MKEFGTDSPMDSKYLLIDYLHIRKEKVPFTCTYLFDILITELCGINKGQSDHLCQEIHSERKDGTFLFLYSCQ